MILRPIVPTALLCRLRLLTILTIVWVAGWGFDVAHTDRPAPWVTIADLPFRQTGPLFRHLAGEIVALAEPRPFVIIVVVLMLVCAVGRSGRALIASTASIAIQLGLVELIVKPLVASSSVPGGTPAYPSGHTATTACVATLVVLLLGQPSGPLRRPLSRSLRWLFTGLGLLLTPSVGLAILIASGHTVIDVIGAIPLGVTVTLLVGAATDKLTLAKVLEPKPVGNKAGNSTTL